MDLGKKRCSGLYANLKLNGMGWQQRIFIVAQAAYIKL